MGKYVFKQNEVEAFQFTENNVDAIRSFIPHDWELSFNKEDKEYTVRDESGHWTGAREGCWIIREHGDFWNIYTDEDFKEIYSPEPRKIGPFEEFLFKGRVDSSTFDLKHTLSMMSEEDIENAIGAYMDKDKYYMGPDKRQWEE